MSRKRNRDAKRRGTLEVDVKAGGVQALHAVGIGAVVSGPSAGNRKIKATIKTVTGDETAVLIGTIDCTKDES